MAALAFTQEPLTPALHTLWCHPATVASGQGHPTKSQGLLLGLEYQACLLVIHHCTHLSLILILHVPGPVSSCLPIRIAAPLVFP